MKYTGNVAYVYPNNYDIDYIIGIPNISLQKTEDIVNVLMKDYEDDFLSTIKPGDIIVGGKNFGYGHAHPQPMTGMRAVGINIVLAESFTFPFYRSELASGMMMLVCKGITEHVKRGSLLEVDLDKFTVTVDNSVTLNIDVPGDYARQCMNLGGVVTYLKNK